MNSKVALIGNPNCGKTTLFNALTGAKQRIGNWPGVTVECKTGSCYYQGQQFEIIDLPGIYSLTTAALNNAVDERIASEYITSGSADVFINVIDASNLERHLYLTAQLIEMGVPLILAVNMLDVAKRRGIRVDLAAFAKQMGCEVIGIQAHRQHGISGLLAALAKPLTLPAAQLHYPPVIINAIDTLKSLTSTAQIHHSALCIRLLEDDALAHAAVSETVQEQVKSMQQSVRDSLHEDADIVLADTRYAWVQQLVSQVVQKFDSQQQSMTNRLDNLVLHRFWGIPIFFAVMYAMFVFAINIGGAFQDFFTLGSDALFVQGLSDLLLASHCPVWLVTLLSSGAGKGISTTLGFIPVLGALFLFLAFLEDCGYMARAAFVMDRCMQTLGLPGKAFVPLLVGFGCNVPAIMAARTLEQQQERIITILMTPFMSCGARLAIYTVFVAAFFPVGGQNIVFLLYLAGIVIAVATALLLRRMLAQGHSSTLIMELPSYHLPTIRSVYLHTWSRLKSFLFRAGKLIVPLCLLLSLLNTVSWPGSLTNKQGAQSLLSTLGQTITPLFSPLGLHSDNWPATVGLVTGTLAKEVVVATLNTLYTQTGDITTAGTEDFNWRTGLQLAWASIPANFQQLKHAFSNPITASAKPQELTANAMGQMYQRFDGKIGAFAYLLFILLYVPCASTIAAITRELNYRWALFAVFWSTGLAYGAATLFYQTATFLHHPWTSLTWMAGISAALIAMIGLVYYYGRAVLIAKPTLIGGANPCY